MKMINMGSKNVFIGRAFLYGLGALGTPGVTGVFDIFKKELDIAMALTGTTSLMPIITVDT